MTDTLGLITREHALRAAQNAVRNQGYAVAVHGSWVKDLDLIAVPWRDTALDAQAVAEIIAEAIPGYIEKGSPEQKPHGRLGFTIRPLSHYGFDSWYIDLSVMPRACDWTLASTTCASCGTVLIEGEREECAQCASEAGAASPVSAVADDPELEETP